MDVSGEILCGRMREESRGNTVTRATPPLISAGILGKGKLSQRAVLERSTLMKKILAIAAAAALTAGVSAFAANPFSDVTPDD